MEKLDRIGICSVCNRKMKLAVKGRHGKSTFCHTCQNRRYRQVQLCINCGQVKQLQCRGLCHNCYFKIGANSHKVTCKKCKKRQSHYAKGLCWRCYNKESSQKYYRSHCIRDAEYDAKIRRWQKAHPEKMTKYWRDYKKRVHEEPIELKVNRVSKALKFVNSGQIGIARNQVHCSVVYRGRFGLWENLIIYQEKLSSAKSSCFYAVQTVNLKDGTQSFKKMTWLQIKNAYNIILPQLYLVCSHPSKIFKTSH